MNPAGTEFHFKKEANFLPAQRTQSYNIGEETSELNSKVRKLLSQNFKINKQKLSRTYSNNPTDLKILHPNNHEIYRPFNQHEFLLKSATNEPNLSAFHIDCDHDKKPTEEIENLRINQGPERQSSLHSHNNKSSKKSKIENFNKSTNFDKLEDKIQQQIGQEDINYDTQLNYW